MLTKFRIHSNPTNKMLTGTYIECICEVKDIPALITSGINGEFEYENRWYDFCNSKCIELPVSSSSFYKAIDFVLLPL